MCSSGGSSGGGQAPSTDVSYTDALGNKQTVGSDVFGKTMGLNPLSAGTDWNKILADPAQAAKYQGMGKAQDMLYPGGVKPQYAQHESFLGTKAVGRRDTATPDRRAGIASQFAGSTEGQEGGKVVLQDTAEETFGGQVGAGEEGFGRRALLSGEGTLEENLGPVGTPEQSGVPTTAANPDLQTDPNAPLITSRESVAPDVNYIVPTSEREEQVISFMPNDPNAAYVARGPISSNLRSRRTGWGNSVTV
jgi:hypothetical protein